LHRVNLIHYSKYPRSKRLVLEWKAALMPSLEEFNVKSPKERVRRYRRYVYETGALNRPDKLQTRVIDVKTKANRAPQAHIRAEMNTSPAASFRAVRTSPVDRNARPSASIV
jgi:hypothetical protein